MQPSSTGNPKQISAASTFIWKRVFPVFWFGIVGMSTLISLGVSASLTEIPPVMLLAPLTMVVIGWFVMKKLIFPLADEVWDAGDALIIKQGGQETRLPLTDILQVKHSWIMNPERVVLTLRQPNLLGESCTFLPPVRIIQIGPHPLVTELSRRVSEARMKYDRRMAS